MINIVARLFERDGGDGCKSPKNRDLHLTKF
jgi:hypothetical protein